MKLKAVPESPLEWLALQLNLVPLPLLQGQMFPVISKAVLVATDRGVFNAIGRDAGTAEEIAGYCGLLTTTTTQLLQLLCASGYLSFKQGRYGLTAMSKKWLLTGSPSDLSDLLIYNNRIVWKWMEYMETYLETGQGIDYHQSFSEEEWVLYQKAMMAVARSEVKEFARKCPVPGGARHMLDIGGAHGLHVKSLQQRYPDLGASILDLPGAWAAASAEGEERIERIRGNILELELPSCSYDLILISSLAHHFSQADNRSIARKVAGALKPGGIYVVNEFVNPGDENLSGGLVGASSNLFFGLTSTSGTWTVKETQQWQTEAGLKPLKPIGYTAIPGRFQMVARKT